MRRLALKHGEAETITTAQRHDNTRDRSTSCSLLYLESTGHSTAQDSTSWCEQRWVSGYLPPPRKRPCNFLDFSSNKKQVSLVWINLWPYQHSLCEWVSVRAAELKWCRTVGVITLCLTLWVHFPQVHVSQPVSCIFSVSCAMCVCRVGVVEVLLYVSLHIGYPASITLSFRIWDVSLRWQLSYFLYLEQQWQSVS